LYADILGLYEEAAREYTVACSRRSSITQKQAAAVEVACRGGRRTSTTDTAQAVLTLKSAHRGKSIRGVFAPQPRMAAGSPVCSGQLAARKWCWCLCMAARSSPECMAGPGNNPVQVFRTSRAVYLEFLRLWTGFELPSSWSNLPCYGVNRKRNILDFMRWPRIALGAQDLNDTQRSIAGSKVLDECRNLHHLTSYFYN
jgi:hypothetical protein